MSSVNNSFFGEVRSFANNHKVLCVLTLGLALAVYSLGNLAGRAVPWISECIGATKKADSVAREQLQSPTTSLPEATVKPHIISDNPSLPVGPLSLPTTPRDKMEKIGKTESSKPASRTADKLLTAYNTPKEGWVMVPPKDKIKAEEPFIIGSGAIGYTGNGRWKIHVSINPLQMKEAIPIILEVLHGPDAPRLGFKMQTKANLDSVHQIGKELAIIFDSGVEEAALNGNLDTVENCLSLLWGRLYSAGIRPEPGFVLTPETMEVISKMPEGSQVKEKQNLNTGKFDRAIPCPKSCNFFYYRDENFAPMLDDEIGDLRGIPGVYAASDIIALAKRQPDLAHNPTQSPDPFLRLRIKAS